MEIVETTESVIDGITCLTDTCYRDEMKNDVVWTWTRGKYNPNLYQIITDEEIQAELLINQMEILENQDIMNAVLSELYLNTME